MNPSSLKKKNLSLFIGSILFLIFGSYSSIYSQSKVTASQKDLLNKKNKLNDDIKQLNSQLSQTKAIKKSQINTIVVINTKIKVREELISTINNELTEINSGIKDNVTEINYLYESLKKLKSEYAKMIYFAQRNQDSYTKIMFLFSAGNFNQAYMRVKYFQQYAAFRKKQANEILVMQTNLNDKLKNLELQRNNKNELLGNEKKEKNQLDGEKRQQEIVLNELQQQEKELKAQLEKKKRDAEELQMAIKRLIEAEIKRKTAESAKIAAAKAAKAAKTATTEKNKPKTDKSKNEANTKVTGAKIVIPELTAEAEALGADFSSNRGKLPWPVIKGVICQPYGEYEHPAIKGFMMNNNGVEICTSKGSQARAVFAGEVTSIAISPTGGKLIIIRHGEYLSVYSNIGSVFVKQGDKVTIKQFIGTILDEDGKTSMNLQIWKGQKTTDPSGWLFNGK
jgi:septal ring factor EnvC (AmiA/AmiB activator)